jgi:hypothetical protein
MFAQHGYGKTDKIQTGIQLGHISGVVLSPKDEDPARLVDYIEDLRRQFGDRIEILFDPQFYATTISAARDGHLPDYPYYQPGLTRAQFIAPAKIRRYVRDTISYEVGLDLDGMISPSVLITDFRDPWSQIALSLAQESLEAHGRLQDPPPLYLSLILDENALRSRDALNEFLDIITAWDVDGFYVVVRRNDPNYPALFDEGTLTNLMYLTYVLVELNEFKVISGYSDIVGLLLHAVGARATCTGWFNGLRQFSFLRFLPAAAGRLPRPRYTSERLLNSILLIPELQTIHRVGRIGSVLSRTAFDGPMASGSPAAVPWPLTKACLHHWEVLSRVARDITSAPSIGARLTALEDRIRRGIATYGSLDRLGVEFEPMTGPRHLGIWLQAITNLRAELGI